MNILVVLGSVREGRRGERVSNWFSGVAVAAGHHVDRVDLAQIKLPMEMEETIPGATTNFEYTNSYTKAWSDKVRAADAVVFVHPEYNGSVSAALKNAIDHLYHEWKDKKIGLVGYGGAGGSADAQAHLRFIGENRLSWDLAPTSVQITHIKDAFDTDQNTLKDNETYAAAAHQMLTELAQQ